MNRSRCLYVVLACIFFAFATPHPQGLASIAIFKADTVIDPVAKRDWRWTSEKSEEDFVLICMRVCQSRYDKLENSWLPELLLRFSSAFGLRASCIAWLLRLKLVETIAGTRVCDPACFLFCPSGCLALALYHTCSTLLFFCKERKVGRRRILFFWLGNSYKQLWL